MIHVEPPEEYNGSKRSVFIAGGITNCLDWQKELIEGLKTEDIVIFNPRRKKFSIKDDGIKYEQIKWEHDYLRKSDAISFWFPDSSDCPITLYELGTWSNQNKKIFIGVSPKYSRRYDVETQTKLIKPEIEIVYSLSELSQQIKNWIS